MRKCCAAFFLLLGLYLGLHNGYIALWNSQKTQPEHVFPYPASLYPPIDQAALENGIPVQDPESAVRLLEDFLS